MYKPKPVDTTDKDIAEYLKIVLRGRNDPIWFAEELLGVNLFPVQKEIMSSFYNDDYKRMVIVAGMRCCDGESLVLMGDETTKKLKDIKEFDVVASVDSYSNMVSSTVTQTFYVGEKIGYELRVYSGEKIIASGEHKFLTHDGWRKAEDLNIGDYIIREFNGILEGDRLEGKINVGNIDMYDICVDSHHNYIANTFCVHNSGKSALASIMTAYEYFLLSTTDDPAAYYGLMPNQLISISCIAASESQAKDTIFSNTRNMIENSEFFQTWTDTKPKEMELTSRSKNIQIRTISSSATTAVGRSNKAVIFDELANFEESTSKKGAWSIYERLIKSTDTFGNDGHIMSISSPRHPTDIMMTLYKRGLEEDNTLALMKPTWEMNPHMTKEALMAEHKYNMQAFYRDYACQPGAYSAVQFPEGVKMDEKIVNVLENTITNNMVPHVLSIDPAVKNDAFGMATGYIDVNGKIVVDGCSRFEREHGMMMINPIEIRNFIDVKIKELAIHTVVFDVWLFPELLHHLEDELGLNVIKHIVYKEDYDRWRELQTDKLLSLVDDDFLRLEAESLVIKNEKKVDHTSSSTKDVSDCVCNCIWHLTENSDAGRTPAIFTMVGH